MKYIKLFENFLNEGLIKSVDIETCISILEKNLINVKKIQANSYNSNLIIIEFTKPTLIKDIIKLINNLGYYILQIRNVNNKETEKFNDNDLIITAQIGAKYPKEEYLSEYLYHITRKDNLEKILKIGLVPKSKEKIVKHPDRIYFFKEEEVAIYFVDELYLDPENAVILKIDTKGLNIKIYQDPEISDSDGGYAGDAGYFTTSNIPPSHITVLNYDDDYDDDDDDYDDEVE